MSISMIDVKHANADDGNQGKAAWMEGGQKGPIRKAQEGPRRGQREDGLVIKVQSVNLS